MIIANIFLRKITIIAIIDHFLSRNDENEEKFQYIITEIVLGDRRYEIEGSGSGLTQEKIRNWARIVHARNQFHAYSCSTEHLVAVHSSGTLFGQQ